MIDDTPTQVTAEALTHKQAFVVLNPSSGRADASQLRELLKGRLDQHGWTYEIYEITGNEDVAAIVRAACARGAELVVAAGGDGTVASVVNGVWQSNACFGILPAGTGNLLARAMGIPTAAEPALDLIIGDHVLQPLDLMHIGQQVFVLDVSVGISARAMRDTSTEQKQRFGVLAYIWPIARDLIRLRRRHFNLTIDGRQIQARASEILIANGAFLNKPPFPYGPPEGFNDQQFDTYILAARSLPDYLRVLWALARGSWQGQTALRTLAVHESITIDAVRQQQPVQADGESIGFTPVTVKLLPSAVRLIVPPRA